MTFQFKNHDLPLVAVITVTSWHEPPRIRHQVTRQLTRFYNVLYIQKKLNNREDYWENINGRLIFYNPGCAQNFSPQLYANVPFIHHLINKIFYKQITNVLSHYKGNIVLVNFEHDFPEITYWKGFSYKIYICNDEFPKMARSAIQPRGPKYIYQSILFQQYENSVAKNCDLILTQHHFLAKKLKKVNKNIKIQHPGHEFDKLPKIKPHKSEPIKVAFMGYINYRLEMEWLKAVSNQEDMILNLIGPLEKIKNGDFTNFKNIQFIDTLQGDKLLQTLADMDVLIMPYRKDIFEVKILSINNKIYQYIASLRPIVISDLPNYFSFPDGVIYKATSGENFIEKIKLAHLQDCQEYIHLRKKIALSNTWDVKGNELYNYIQSNIN